MRSAEFIKQEKGRIPMTEKQIEKLVKKAIKGNEQALSRLVELKAKNIVFSTYKVLGNYHDAEDAAQEVILRMYANIHKLKDPKAFHAWIHRIAINQSYKMKDKSINKHEQLSGDDAFMEVIEQDIEFLPHEFAESKEQRERLQRLIQSLPEERRLMITMFYYDGLSYKEIAYAMDKPEGTVSTQIRRAKASLKKTLEVDGRINDSRTNTMAAIPVLTTVLNEEASSIITKSSVDSLVAFANTKAVAGISGTSNIFSTTKMIILTIICTGVISIGVYQAVTPDNMSEAAPQTASSLSEPIEEASPQRTSKGDIILTGGKTNPDLISLSQINEDYEEVIWTIKNTKGNIIASGKGALIQDQLPKLYEDNPSGIYKAEFTAKYSYGQLDGEIDFTIYKKQ